MTTTDDLGVASFEVPPSLDLELSAWSELGGPGNAHTEIPMLSPGECRELSVEVSGAQTIRFHAKVMTSEGLQPIAGALVEVTQTQSTYWDNREGPRIPGLRRVVICSTASESDGHFELRLRRGLALDISVQAPGRSIALVNVGPLHETRANSQDVLLRRSAALRARIADAEGHPLQEAAVRLSTDCSELAGSPEQERLLSSSARSMDWTCSAGPDGVCALLELPSEVPLRVELRVDGRIVREDLEPITLAPGEDRSLEWRVGAGCTLLGLVLDQQRQPIAERAIWLLRVERNDSTLFQTQDAARVVLRTETNTDGRFQFEDLSAGSWLVGPAPVAASAFLTSSDAVAPVAQRVEIREGTRNQQVIVMTSRGLFIRGTVEDSLGKPTPNISVFGIGAGEHLVLHGESDDEGKFALGPLPQGQYRLHTTGRGVLPSTPTEAVAGQSGIVLQLKPACSLVGTVVDASTGLGCEAWVSCILSGEEDFPGDTVTSKADGSFRFEGLEAGSYHLSARGLRGGVAAIKNLVLRTEVGSDEQTLRLSPGARLRIRNKGEERSILFAVQQGGIYFAASAVRAGQVEEIEVPSGHVAIKFWGPRDSTEVREFDLGVGEEREVVVGGV